MENDNKHKYFTDNHLSELGVAFYAESLKSNKEEELPDSLRQHVQDCFKCKNEILSIIDVLEQSSDSLLAKAVDEEVNKNKKKLNTIRLLKYAASIGVIIVLSLLAYNQIKNRIELKEQQSFLLDQLNTIKADSQKWNVNEAGKLAFRSSNLSHLFTANDSLDKIILNSDSSSKISYIKPEHAEDYVVGDTIRFSFDAPGRIEYKIAVLDNKGNQLIEGRIKSGKSYDLKFVIPGLYYWQLVEKEELRYISKFIVLAEK